MSECRIAAYDSLAAADGRLHDDLSDERSEKRRKVCMMLELRKQSKVRLQVTIHILPILQADDDDRGVPVYRMDELRSKN